MPPRLRILRAITWLPVGGIERRLVATLPRLDRDRFHVQLVCLRERGPLADELEAAGVPVHLVPFRKRLDPSALRRLAALIRDQRIDLVHSHMYRANVPATVAARLARSADRRPVVWGQIHNVDTWETRRQVWMDRFLCRWRAGMIAVSERVKQDAMRTLNLPADRVRVIYNGVELDRFRAAHARRAAVRARLNADDNHVVFVFAARLVEQKRCRDFLGSFGRLQSRPGGDRLRAWVLGDGPLSGALGEQAAALPSPDAVAFVGRRDDVEDYLAAADIFVLPSTKEGFSNALVEAMASGLACVATDVGGNAEAIRHDTDGLIVPPLDLDRLTDAMAALAFDPDRRDALAAAASARAEAFGLEKMIADLERLYAESSDRTVR